MDSSLACKVELSLDKPAASRILSWVMCVFSLCALPLGCGESGKRATQDSSNSANLAYAAEIATMQQAPNVEAIDTTFIARLLESHPEYFGNIVKDGPRYRVQILLGRIASDTPGKPRLVRSGFRVDAEYFYPASSIKLLAAVGALEHLNSYDNPMLGADTPMTIGPLFDGDTPQNKDESNLDGGTITAGHEIRKLFLVSDNPAFNRLFDLCGHESLNSQMHRAGLGSTVINHRLSESRAIPRQLDTAAITFHTPVGDVEQAAQQSGLSLRNTSRETQVGVGYLSKDQRIDTPMEFAGRNGISLVDLQNALIMTVRPDIDLGLPGFELSDTDRLRLVYAMGQFPHESLNPQYRGSDYPDHAYKLFLPGVRRAFMKADQYGTGSTDLSSALSGVDNSANIRIYNKLGQAYGFTIENAYIVTGRPEIEPFFLTAVIYTNEDGILNDNIYEYAAVAEPFMEHLAEVVARSLWK